MKKIDLTPRPKTLIALSHSNYHPTEAIADIVDNSIDAGAQSITVLVSNYNKSCRVDIIDDGTGMSESIVEEALKLGSDTEKDSSSLGKFGVGLITSSLSIGKKLRIISKMADSQVVTGVLDPELIRETNEWVGEVGDSPLGEEEEFYSYFKKDPPSGTVVTIYGVDINSQSLRDSLPAFLGRVYRYFLQTNLKICVGSKSGEVKDVQPIDPLEWNYEGTERLLDNSIEVNCNGVKGNLYIKFANLDTNRDRVTNKASTYAITAAHQGIFIVRNNREIAAGSKFGDVWRVFDNRSNYARCEIRFDSDLDDVLGIVYEKTNLKDIPQSIVDQVKEHIRPQIEGVMARWDKKHPPKADKDMQKIFDKAEGMIASKKPLLELPYAKVSSRKEGTEHGTKKGTGKGSPHKNGHKTTLEKKNVKFSVADFGQVGPLFEVSAEANGIILIKWNSSHCFYKKFSETSKDESIEYLQYVIAALAMAQLKYCQEEFEQMLLNINSSMSNNLRCLMS